MIDENRYQIAKALKTPIAIVNENGGVEWRNGAFDDANSVVLQAPQ